MCLPVDTVLIRFFCHRVGAVGITYSRILLFSKFKKGKRDLQSIWQLNSILHLNLVQPDEEKAQGPVACHRVQGKSLSCKIFDISFKDDFYNAWEEDIAVVNIFFGKDTVMGEKGLIDRNSVYKSNLFRI